MHYNNSSYLIYFQFKEGKEVIILNLMDYTR